ncbi:uncharacterized protein BXIN_0813 [Babesia sp. Xinjiang]|uniref:uncharacterized protein n=1 Tax=Babesia sp. Xinjiang TaxID=462227 RepID=UPI000A2493CC|nr:uncharacterized protein BXIN_0813 [Babesia sp. Xinjiang]ORM41317.1 hypothetical protein BXIN_0813 [Babesia sp. Xinjiang]
MLPSQHKKETDPFPDYKPTQHDDANKDVIGDAYPMEPLVLGESVATMGSTHTYRTMNLDAYKQEIVGMEPSYLADWKGSKWREPSTPMPSQESYCSTSVSNSEAPGNYANYPRHVHYNPHDTYPSEHPYATPDKYKHQGIYAHHDHCAGPSMPSPYCEVNNGFDNSTYHMNSYNPMVKDVNSLDTYAHSMSSSFDTMDRIHGFGSGANTVCGSYDMPSMHCSATDAPMPDMPSTGSGKRHYMMQMNACLARKETMHPPKSEYMSMLTQQYLGPSQMDVSHNIGKVSTDELATFTSHFEDLCKPIKRRVGSYHRMEKAAYVAARQCSHGPMMKTGEDSSAIGGTSSPKRCLYESGGKVNGPPQVCGHGKCNQGYVCDPGYVNGHDNATSTPTTRALQMARGAHSMGDMGAEMTTYQSDPYHGENMETLKPGSMDSSIVYNAPPMTEMPRRPPFDSSMMACYQQGILDPSVDMPVMPPGNTSHVEGGESHVAPDPSPVETHGDEYSNSFVEKPMPAYQSGSTANVAPEEYRHGAVDGLYNFKGVMDTFRDEENSMTYVDPATLRQSFEGNRYIEDLGSQYDLTRNEAPAEEAFVYLRTNAIGEFGSVGLQKQKVVAASIATSSELNELLITCNSEPSSYQPTITWDEAQQAHIVTWWASDDKGLRNKKTRAFADTGYGKSAAYEEAARFAMSPETQIRPGSLIRWYPGFNIPIGTSGRTNLRKVLHMDRMKNSDLCDPVLAVNGMKIATKSTFGDMTIVELYKAAYVLGLWDVAAYNCLKTCKRRGYSYRWIHEMQLRNKRVTLDSLKYLRDLRESLNVHRHSKRAVRGSARNRAR